MRRGTAMADAWTTAVEFLSNPLVAGVVGAIAGILGYDLTIRRSERRTRKRNHSILLMRDVLLPWSKVQIYHQDVWTEIGIPRFVADPSPEWDEPVYRWAKAHLEKADPATLLAWGKAQESLDKEKAQVETVKQTIREAFANQIAIEFSQNSLRALPTKDELQRDVYFEDTIVYVVFMDVRTILKNLPNQRTYFGVGWAVQTISSGAAYLGSIVLFGAMEVARLQRQQDASVERWDRSVSATVNNEKVREVMRVAMDHDAEASKQLALAEKGLRAQIQMIEHGVPIPGKCELGY